MKLIIRIALRLSLAMSLLMGIWGAFFYYAVLDEINDETDDMLEEYSEDLIMRYLAHAPLSTEGDRTNNEFEFRPLDTIDAKIKPSITYMDSVVYVRTKHEGESARVLKTIFYDEEQMPVELTVMTPTIEKQDFWLTILSWGIGLWLILLITAVVLNIFIYQGTMRPLYKMLRWLRDYRVGQGNQKPLDCETDIIEFGELKQALEEYTHRAEEVFEEQKLFIGNLSHELQTPLAISRHYIEGLMEDDTLQEHQLQELAKSYNSLEYMTRLNKSLLLLFRIENHQYQADSNISMHELIDTLRADYAEIYAHLDIELTYNCHCPWIIQMNETLATMFISNLMKNAYLYNKAGGRISISLSEGNLEICNTSEVDKPLEEDKVFTRFYQAQRREHSTGLGLALVQAICRNSGLVATYSYHSEMHCFKISYLIQN